MDGKKEREREREREWRESVVSAHRNDEELMCLHWCRIFLSSWIDSSIRMGFIFPSLSTIQKCLVPSKLTKFVIIQDDSTEHGFWEANTNWMFSKCLRSTLISWFSIRVANLKNLVWSSFSLIQLDLEVEYTDCLSEEW